MTISYLLVYTISFVLASRSQVLMIGESIMQKNLWRSAESKNKKEKESYGVSYGFTESQK